MLEQFRKELIRKGTTFDCGATTKIQSNRMQLLKLLPKQYSNYTMTMIPRPIIHVTTKIDPRSLVSFALLERSLNIEPYVSKLPIMCLNVHRLNYTRAAFSIYYPEKMLSTKAVDFLLNYSIRRLDRLKDGNERFSDLLHELRSSGNEDYIQKLAEELKFDIDIVKSGGFAYRYKYVHYRNLHQSHSAILPTTPYTDIVPGHLTAVFNDGIWYVHISKYPLIGTTAD